MYHDEDVPVMARVCPYCENTNLVPEWIQEIDWIKCCECGEDVQ